MSHKVAKKRRTDGPNENKLSYGSIQGTETMNIGVAGNAATSW
jgi:hypothetical protein